MKSTFTKLKQVSTALLVAWGALASQSLEAQLCSGQSNYGSGNCLVGGSDKPGDIESVTIKDKSGKVLGSWGSLSTNCQRGSGTYLGILNASNPIDVTAGEELTLEISGGSWATGGWTTRVGVWIDANRDNSYASAENLIDPNSNSDLGFWMLAYRKPRATLAARCAWQTSM